MSSPSIARLENSAGPNLFARYAYAPNLLGYCGPHDAKLLTHLMEESTPPLGELASVVFQFDGAYPYLELIAAASGYHPLDQPVVEAYWTGNSLLSEVDTLLWGNSLDDRFRRRAGREWTTVEQAILFGGLPTHAFHVFCVYPWVGLLRSGAESPALEVLDRCRISWGVVVGTSNGEAMVRSRRLQWDEGQLGPAAATIDRFRLPSGFGRIDTGDTVSLHWDTVCERLGSDRLAALRRYHNGHLAMANRQLRVTSRKTQEGHPADLMSHEP
jgi:hypothetical protein